MLSQQHKDLIYTLTQLTQNGMLIWQKGEGLFAYEIKPIKDGAKYLVDKYFSNFEGKRNTCYNLTILKSDNVILTELVLCTYDDTNNELYFSRHKTMS